MILQHSCQAFSLLTQQHFHLPQDRLQKAKQTCPCRARLLAPAIIRSLMESEVTPMMFPATSASQKPRAAQKTSAYIQTLLTTRFCRNCRICKGYFWLHLWRTQTQDNDYKNKKFFAEFLPLMTLLNWLKVDEPGTLLEVIAAVLSSAVGP